MFKRWIIVCVAIGSICYLVLEFWVQDRIDTSVEKMATECSSQGADALECITYITLVADLENLTEILVLTIFGCIVLIILSFVGRWVYKGKNNNNGNA